MSSAEPILVPPRRLGALLRDARLAAGNDLLDIASRSAHLTVVDLDDLENGRRAVDDGVVRELMQLYGLERVDLVPQRSRLVIDLDEGLISMESTRVPVDRPDPDTVLVTYLALIHRLRGLEVGAPLEIRDLDVDVLASALRVDTEVIETRLQRLLTDSAPVRRTERDLRRRVLLPLAGVVVASTAAGVLILVSEDGIDTGTPDPDRVMVQIPDVEREVSPDPAPSPTVTTEIGDAAVVRSSESRETDTGSSLPPLSEVPTDIIDAAVVEAGGMQQNRD